MLCVDRCNETEVRQRWGDDIRLPEFRGRSSFLSSAWELVNSDCWLPMDSQSYHYTNMYDSSEEEWSMLSSLRDYEESRRPMKRLVTGCNNNHLAITISKTDEFVDYNASNMDFPAEKLHILKHQHRGSIKHWFSIWKNMKYGHNLLLCSWVLALNHGKKRVVDLWPFG